jgi:hypothetical protein
MFSWFCSKKARRFSLELALCPAMEAVLFPIGWPAGLDRLEEWGRWAELMLRLLATPRLLVSGVSTLEPLFCLA